MADSGNPTPLAKRAACPAKEFPALKPKVYRLLDIRLGVRVDIEELSGAHFNVAGHVNITAKSRGRHTPEEAATDQGDPDSFSSCDVPRRKAWGLNRPAEGSCIFDRTAHRVRLKLRLLAAENRGAPGATLRLMSVQKEWTGHREDAREPAKEQKQGRRMMQPETRFLRQENLAMGKGDHPRNGYR